MVPGQEEPWENVCEEVNELRSVFTANTSPASRRVPLEVERPRGHSCVVQETMPLIRTANISPCDGVGHQEWWWDSKAPPHWKNRQSCGKENNKRRKKNVFPFPHSVWWGKLVWNTTKANNHEKVHFFSLFIDFNHLQIAFYSVSQIILIIVH